MSEAKFIERTDRVMRTFNHLLRQVGIGHANSPLIRALVTAIMYELDGDADDTAKAAAREGGEAVSRDKKDEERACGIPAATLPPCDLEWGHDGMMHSNGGDGFYARLHDDTHRKRQRARLDRGDK